MIILFLFRGGFWAFFSLETCRGWGKKYRNIGGEKYYHIQKLVMLCKADDRLGGRVNSVVYGDGVLEMGAQWIHGRGDCPLWKFVNDNQIAGNTFALIL